MKGYENDLQYCEFDNCSIKKTLTEEEILIKNRQEEINNNIEKFIINTCTKTKNKYNKLYNDYNKFMKTLEGQHRTKKISEKEYEFKVDSAHQEVAKKFKALKLAKKTKK